MSFSLKRCYPVLHKKNKYLCLHAFHPEDRPPMSAPQLLHDDQYFLEALIRHDRQAIELIYRNNAERVKSMIQANGGSAADAADVFQEALTDVYRQAQRGYTLHCGFNAFFYTVCRNKWLDQLRKKGKAEVTISQLERLVDEDAETAAQNLYLHEERLCALAQAVERLGHSCREIFRLVWSVNPESGKYYSLQEVAERLNLSYGYLRKKKSECEQALKDKIRASPDFVKLKGD